MIFVLLYAFTINERYNGLAEYGAGQIGYLSMEFSFHLYYSEDKMPLLGMLKDPMISEFSVTPYCTYEGLFAIISWCCYRAFVIQ